MDGPPDSVAAAGELELGWTECLAPATAAKRWVNSGFAGGQSVNGVGLCWPPGSKLWDLRGVELLPREIHG